MDKELKRVLAEMTAGADHGRVETAVRERIGRGRTVGWKMHRHRPIRLLAAAVVVLVLSVAVCAAVWGKVQVLIPDGEGSGYSVKINDAGDVQLSGKVIRNLEEYRQSAKKTEHGYTDYISFATWTEMADFLDCGILVSDLFAEKSTTMTAAWDAEGELETLAAGVTFQIPDSSARCSITINIPLNWGESWSLYWVNENVTLDENGNPIYNDAEKEVLFTSEAYVTSSGIPVTMVSEPVCYRMDGEIAECTNTEMYICQAGILYQISVDRVESAAAFETARMVADSLH